MRRPFVNYRLIPFCLSTLLLILSPGGFTAPPSIPAEMLDTYDQGVMAYRDGHYDKAHKIFRQLVKQAPQSVEGQYYYAITLAQLGRFKEAKAAYEAVIRMAPQSEAAALAQEGLQSLPDPDRLDAPPRFQAQNLQSNPVATQSGTGEHSAQQPQQNASPFGNVDPQMLQTMMMMGAFGGGGNGFNPMMIPLMQSLTRPQNGKPGEAPYGPAIPPESLSTMMMNQMMMDFNPFFGKDD